MYAAQVTQDFSPKWDRGEVILEGTTSVGALGFKKNAGFPSLVVHYPWNEHSYSYQTKGLPPLSGTRARV
jgi:hypothetical protein